MEPFKNLFSSELIRTFGFHLTKNLTGFERKSFEEELIARLPDLELKERSQMIADKLHEILPMEFGARNQILLAMLHPDESGFANEGSNEDGICGWGVMPMAELIGQQGLDDFENSLLVLKEMTKRSSSEFGIRYFLKSDPERAMEVVQTWASDDNEHVRRLVSEGTRPKLPWGMRLPAFVEDPSPILPLLTALRDDPEEYVRRSVANNLNDIAKDHPDLVADLAVEWMKDADRNRSKLVRHACRTLIKAGHARALSAFGISAPKLKNVELNVATPTVLLGDNLSFELSLTSDDGEPQDLIIDYVVHFKKANGRLAGKVFKWTKFSLSSQESTQLSRAHSIKPITTRVYYPGEQALSVRINGEDFCMVTFILEER